MRISSDVCEQVVALPDGVAYVRVEDDALRGSARRAVGVEVGVAVARQG